MKHISFDESTVLTEFAKIANVRGLIKTAADKSVAEKMYDYVLKYLQPKPERESDDRLIWLAVHKKASSLYNSKSVMSVDEIWGELDSARRSNTTDKNTQYSMMVEKLLEKARLSISRKRSASVKLNKDKLYDVSGETGEDLVNSAHPGGGTKVDNSKEKFETIVEQQKEDMKIISKKPTGKYAHIKNILIALADKLDRMGYKQAADKVDNIIPPTQEQIQLNLAINDLREHLANTKSIRNYASIMPLIEHLLGVFDVQDVSKLTTDHVTGYKNAFLAHLLPEEQVKYSKLFDNINKYLGASKPTHESGTVVKKQRKTISESEARQWADSFNNIINQVDLSGSTLSTLKIDLSLKGKQFWDRWIDVRRKMLSQYHTVDLGKLLTLLNAYMGRNQSQNLPPLSQVPQSGPLSDQEALDNGFALVYQQRPSISKDSYMDSIRTIKQQHPEMSTQQAVERLLDSLYIRE